MKGILNEDNVREELGFEVLFAKTMEMLEKLRKYDQYTYEHSLRVAKYSLDLGKQLSISRSEQMELYIGCLLHDIGKMNTSYEVIAKPSKLTQEEYEEVKQHPKSGYEILNSQNVYLKYPAILDIVLNHHERMNGSGYPSKQNGGELSLNTKIVGIVDSFDAMTSNRTYREGKDVRSALDELEKCETLYDQSLVKKFIELIERKIFKLGFNLS